MKPGTTDQVDGYSYTKGQWSGPSSVQLSGDGDMNDNIQPLSTIDFSKIPDMYKIASDKAKEIEGGTVERRVVYFTTDNKTYATIEIDGAREKYLARYDGQGNLLEMDKQ